jgi:signal transduction histidine kinase
LPVLGFVLVGVSLFMAVIVTPQFIYGRLLEWCHLFLLLGFIYAVYAISRAWRAGNSDARTILFGVFASFPFILAEILKNSRVFPINIDFMYMVELGVLVFLLFQVYLLAHHYEKSYRNLETMNQDLERIVQARTSELTTANTVKDRLLSVMSHDIKSPLNSLRGILQIYNKGAISKDEFNHFARDIENDLGKTSMLVENILFWTASQLKGIQIKSEKVDLFELVEHNVELFHTIASAKTIRVTHNAKPRTIIKADPNILNLALRNLLSNAIKFSFENSVIQVIIRIKDVLSIEVKDQGTGMDESTMALLFEPELVSASGTGNEQGTGLGLSLCREYLRKAGGELTAESFLQNGSTFRITFPLK